MRYTQLKLILFLASACITAEIAVRIYEKLTITTGSLYDRVVFSDTRLFKLRPNSRTLVPERYGNIEYVINAEGYRDANHVIADKRSTILWLGDSVSFGLGVRQSMIFTSRIQELLDRTFPQRYRIINMAMFAYDSGDELRALREDGLKYGPKVIALQFYMNDFAIGSAPDKITSMQSASAAINILRFRSALYRKIYQAKDRIYFLAIHDLRRKYFSQTLNHAEPESKLAYLQSKPADSDVYAFQQIKSIQSLAKQIGAKFWIMISPDEVQLFDSRYDQINKRFMQFCHDEKYQCFDPLESFRKRKDKALFYNDGVHFSEHGHAVIANLIVQDLHTRGFLLQP